MSEQTPTNPPDHTLMNAPLNGPSQGGPQIYSVVDLREYVQPELDEELSSTQGGDASYGVETMCECVPVEDCACNAVSFYHGGQPCPDYCSCVGACVSLYWFPY